MNKVFAEVTGLDAEGRHQDAIQLLSRLTAEGDIEAGTRLGKRLMTGDRSPVNLKEGVGHIVRAAERNQPEALAILSNCFLFGMYVKPSWQSAFNALRLAATHGWQPARSVLLVLNNKAWNASSADFDWHKLASKVDLELWHKPPVTASTFSADPLVRGFQDFANHQVCRWLIKRASGKLHRAEVYDSISEEITTHYTRTNRSALFNMMESDMATVLVQTRMSACTGVPFRHFEPMSVLHYAVGEKIDPHFDFIDPQSPDYDKQIAERGQRIITFLVYLNEDYEGGTTDFPELGLSHKGSTGEGLFFVNALPDGSSDVRTLHAGRAPETGEKWVIAQFVRSQPCF